LNCEKISTIWKKSKLDSEKSENMEENSEMIWKIQKKSLMKCVMIWKIWKKVKSNSDKIWTLQKKIVKRYRKYRRN
jgi:hypothetical protein